MTVPASLCADDVRSHFTLSVVVLLILPKVTMEELRGGMLVSGHQVQDAGCMRLFAGGAIMTLLGERRFGRVETLFLFLAYVTRR